jgi:hypothetical protein
MRRRLETRCDICGKRVYGIQDMYHQVCKCTGSGLRTTDWDGNLTLCPVGIVFPVKEELA